jgi:mRNA interferase YafQ
MREIRFTSRFRKDFARIQAGRAGDSLELEMRPVLDLLAADVPLPPKNADHALSGSWRGFRDCHIRPDLVLIYRKVEPAGLELNRLGSHSELFKK